MPTEQQIWERALIKAGLWKRGFCPHDKSTNPCDGSSSFGGRTEINGNMCGSPRFHARHHVRVHPCECYDIPCPPIGDPAATLAMFEWLATKYGDGLMIDRERDEWWVNCAWHSVDLLKVVAAAINAIGDKE